MGSLFLRLGQKPFLVWELFRESLRNGTASCNPDSLFLANVIDKVLQSLETTRSADDAAMQTNRHHFGRTILSLLVQHIERILQMLEESRWCSKSTSGQEFEVVAVI